MPDDGVIAGRYRLLEPLGRSAMSAVWLAEDEELRRRVALKTLAPTADRARFRREARAVAALSHPNICGLFDYGESDDRPYMVLEYLPGGSLEERLAQGPLPDAETRRIAGQIAAGLEHAHERGLVHRDLKPANILFDAEGRAKICDFGIARMGGTGTLTEAGTVLGTAAYISPEQAAGLPAAAASDVYSFGVILFRMLTGQLPFVADSAIELVRMNRDVPAPALASVRADAPGDLAGLADAALAKDPARRPADGTALVTALAGGTVVLAPPAAAGGGLEATQVIRRPPRRRPAALLPALVLALVLLAGGAALALVLADRGGGGSGGPTNASTPSLSLPGVTITRSTSTRATVASTTEPTTTRATTTSAPTTTTAPVTTAAPPTTTHATTTRSVTTAPVTTAPVTTLPATTAPATTTIPPVTTAPATTAPVTTDTTATTAATTGP
ncbi:MAG TPA: serine/threonine-protein kinase [Gaiellaceae bacterium]|nr:serine/threonine-protein kinase [Gaiellaceae bacterium]